MWAPEPGSPATYLNLGGFEAYASSRIPRRKSICPELEYGRKCEGLTQQNMLDIDSGGTEEQDFRSPARETRKTKRKVKSPVQRPLDSVTNNRDSSLINGEKELSRSRHTSQNRKSPSKTPVLSSNGSTKPKRTASGRKLEGPSSSNRGARQTRSTPVKMSRQATQKGRRSPILSRRNQLGASKPSKPQKAHRQCLIPGPVLRNSLDVIRQRAEGAISYRSPSKLTNNASSAAVATETDSIRTLSVEADDWTMPANMSTYQTAAAEALLAAESVHKAKRTSGSGKQVTKEEDTTDAPTMAKLPWYRRETKEALAGYNHVDRKILHPSGHHKYHIEGPSKMTPDEVLSKQHLVRVWVGNLTKEPPASSSTPEQSRETVRFDELPIDGDVVFEEKVSRLERLRRKLAQQDRWTKMNVDERQRIFKLAAETVRNGQQTQRKEVEAKEMLEQNCAKVRQEEAMLDQNRAKVRLEEAEANIKLAQDRAKVRQNKPNVRTSFTTPPRRQWEPPVVVAPPIPTLLVQSETPIETPIKPCVKATPPCPKSSVKPVVAEHIPSHATSSKPNCERLLGYAPKIRLTATMDLSKVVPKVDTGRRRKNVTPESLILNSKRARPDGCPTKRRLNMWMHKPGGGKDRVPFGKMPKGKNV